MGIPNYLVEDVNKGNNKITELRMHAPEKIAQSSSYLANHF